MLGLAADILGICSFLLTIVLLIRNESMRKELESQRVDYKKEQRSIRNQLIGLRENVWEDSILNRKVISDIRTNLYTFEQKYSRLLRRKDKNHLVTTYALLDITPDCINMDLLCKELDYFIARFERRETK